MHQRKKFREGTLSTERIEKLDKIGMVWDFNEIWKQYFEAAKKFYEENGHLDIQAGYVTKDGLSLGQWFRNMRKAHNDGTLSEDRIKRLEAIGMKWDSYYMRNWLEKYKLAKAYFDEHGDLNIKVKYECPDGTKYGTWIVTQRSQYIKGVLSAEQIELLEKLGMVWNRDDSRWEKGFNHAKKFVENGGDINAMPDNYILDGFKLTSWVRAQRERYKIKKLSQDRIEKLESIGMQWQLQAPAWDMNYQYAKDYFIEHGDLLVNLHYECSDGFKLGAWICNQRTKYRTGKLSDEKIEKLEAIGMVWNTDERYWENGIAHSIDYYNEHGNLKIPQRYVCDDGYNLGTWLSTIRKKYKSGKLELKKTL